jgi:mannose-6-phosphate isomerase-like protein (cupin superfamily)
VAQARPRRSRGRSSLGSLEEAAEPGYARRVDAVVLAEGEGEAHSAGASRITIKATGDATAGTFFLSENEIEAGFPGPPPHVHERLHDMFYVLEGTLTFQIGERTVEAVPGTFVCVPPGVTHTFSNRTDRPARVLNFNTPSGWEEYMRDLAAAFASGEPPTPEAIGRIASRYDFKAVHPE